MKNYSYKIFASIHLLLILSACIVSAYTSYCDFYGFKKENIVVQKMGGVLSTTPVGLYGEISGCNRGYGFFAPNVRSSGLISFENNSKRYFPQFKSAEASIRFSNLENSISDYLLKGAEQKREKLTDSLVSKYYELLYKSISVKLFNENRCSNTNSSISYNLYEYPSLQDFRQRKNQPRLVKIFELQTSLER